MKSKFVTQFNRSPIEISKPTFKCLSEDKTAKSLGKDCEITTIFNRLTKGENIPRVKTCYDENFINHTSLIDADNSLKSAQKYFNSLPPEVKAEYGNDLMKFAKAFTNKEESIYKFGILKKKDIKSPFVSSDTVASSEQKTNSSDANVSTSAD